MSRDDIIRMARQVRDSGHWNQLDLINFAALVAAAAKAEVCDDKAPPCPTCVSLARTVMMDQVGKA